jgi:filamentous hemagglutinin family protein
MNFLHVSISFIVGCLSILSTDYAVAQINSDNTLGTRITPNSVIRGILSNQIDGGTIRGSNLFHSFRDFNIGKDRGVYFSNPDGVQNIFTRVTGGFRSEINGTLGVLGNANLFLANPNGVTFGTNSRLDVSGSFIGTTASAVTFKDGTQFSTIDSSSTLTISTPIGLQFGQTPGAIISKEATLNISPGRTLALVGGTVSIENSKLLAPGGRIEIGSVTANSLVDLFPGSNGWALGYQKGQEFQNIFISKGSLVRANDSENVRGIESEQGRFPELAGYDPKIGITLQGKNIIIGSGSEISTTTFGIADGRDLVIRASEEVKISSGPDNQISGLFSRVDAGAKGQGGNLTIEAKGLIIENGAQINISSTGNGASGNLVIRASEEVDFRGVIPPPSISKIGNSTTITVILPSPNDPRNGLFARAESVQSIAGNITIETKKLLVRNDSLISTSTIGKGKAGNIVIRASESVGLEFGAIYSQVLDGAQAVGGDITIQTETLDLKRGSIISVSNLGTGMGGDLNVIAKKVFLGNQNPISEDRYFSKAGTLKSETASGTGGNISLTLQDFLFLRLGSLISATAGLEGNGGNIIISSPFIIALPQENSDIRANATNGNGGRVSIFAQDLFGIQPQTSNTLRSDITASSVNRVAGIVTVTTPDIKLVRAVEELPAEIISLPEIVQGCVSQKGRGGKLSISGKNKLPVNPVEILIADRSSHSENIPSTNTINTPSNLIVEAQGWIRHPDDSNIVFLKAQPDVTSRTRLNSSCNTYAP